MAATVDIDKVTANLERAWKKKAKRVKAPVAMKAAIDAVMSANDLTFKYILVTGYESKYTNPSIHARCLQTGSSLKESYDARSVCHKAVIPFEKSKGNLFGLSNEPFVNKPARHAEHDQNNSQLRNKILARARHTALEAAQLATGEEVFAGLYYILSRGKTRAASEKRADVTHDLNMARVLDFCRRFLRESDGGARLVSTWGAFVSLLTEEATVRIESPNASDKYTRTVGDVEVIYDKVVISAFECKQRAITADDVRHGLRKASECGVREYIFVVTAGVAAGQESDVSRILKEAGNTLDTALVNIFEELPWLVRSLNPKRRGKFGNLVVDLCRKMRKYESANIAAEIWNSATD